MLNLRLTSEPLPEGVEWKWSRVTNLTGVTLAIAGGIARLYGHVRAAPLVYAVLAVVVLALGAWRRSKHLEKQIRAMGDRLRSAEHLAGVGLGTTAFIHEIKNSVMVTRGFADLARRTAEVSGASPQLLSQLQSIESQSVQMAQDLQSFLSLSSGERASGEIALAAALDQIRHLLGPLARLRNLAIEASIEMLPPRNVSDPSFRQGLLNLGLNAIEHARSVIRLRAAESNGAFLVIVEDDGPGITLDQQRLIFTPFFSGRPGGNGLGLVQARQAAEREGGTATYEVVEQGGSRFILRLPATLPASAVA